MKTERAASPRKRLHLLMQNACRAKDERKLRRLRVSAGRLLDEAPDWEPGARTMEKLSSRLSEGKWIRLEMGDLLLMLGTQEAYCAFMESLAMEEDPRTMRSIMDNVTNLGTGRISSVMGVEYDVQVAGVLRNINGYRPAAEALVPKFTSKVHDVDALIWHAGTESCERLMGTLRGSEVDMGNKLDYRLTKAILGGELRRTAPQPGEGRVPYLVVPAEIMDGAMAMVRHGTVLVSDSAPYMRESVVFHMHMVNRIRGTTELKRGQQGL